MIDLKKLKELVALMVDNDLIDLDIRDGEESVSLSRPSTNAVPAYQAPVAAAVPVAAPAPAAPPVAAAADSNLTAIESPMVGTFYTATNPETPAFVKVGDQIGPDTVVCIIEAMKVFSEVKAEVSGTVKKIVAKNSDSVEFGQTLMLVDPS